jgi:hypothetical protein
MASNMVTVRRLDGATAEVEEAALPILTRRGWVLADSGPVKVADVLEQVGDDPERARLALEGEKSSEKPRKSLVTALEERVASTPTAQNKEK